MSSLSNSSVKIEDLMIMEILVFDGSVMSATYKSILAHRSWLYYLEHKTEENHQRYVEICKRLFN